MVINVLTNGYRVISSGTVLLCDGSSDMKIEVTSDTNFNFSVNFQFINDKEKGKFLDKEVDSNNIFFKCYNFNPLGTGTTNPISIAVIDKKEWFIHFWAYSTGEGGPRKVEYSILEKA